MNGVCMDWYPRKPQSYRNDTWGLTLAEHGAYTLLLDYYYSSESPLPNSDSALASIIGCTVDEWVSVKETVTRYFHVTNERITHSTCDEVIEAQLAKRRDGKERASKYRKKLNCVTRDERVSNAPRGEERRGEENKDICVFRFDEFWELYPRQRRGNKQKSMRAYDRAIIDGRASEDEIIEGVKAYLNSDEVAKGFAKGAQAWLNDDRWAVEYKASMPDFDNPIDMVSWKIEQEEGRPAALDWENAYQQGGKAAKDKFYQYGGRK